MEVVLAGKEVWRRQPHERQSRSVGAAPNGFRHHVQSAAPDGFVRVRDDFRMTVENGSHISVLFLDRQFDARSRIARFGLAREAFDERLLLGEALGLKVSDDELDRRAVDSRLLDIRVYETPVALGGFG